MLHHECLVEMTITTCKRLDTFFEVMDSLCENLTDMWLLNRITVCDDNSSESDRRAMQERFPDFDYIFRDDEKGQHVSIRQLHKHLRSKYVLAWEDDRKLYVKGDWIKRGIAIIERNKQVASVCMRYCNGEKHEDEYGTYYIKQYDPADNSNDLDVNNGQPGWPGWQTAENLQLVQPLKEIPYPFPDHERQFSKAYHAAGHRVAFLDKGIADHLGYVSFEHPDNEPSAYDLNGSAR